MHKLYITAFVAAILWALSLPSGAEISGPVVDKGSHEIQCLIWYCHDKQSENVDAGYMWLDKIKRKTK